MAIYKICPICSKQFKLLRKNKKKYCSTDCAKGAQKAYQKKYFQSDKGKAALAKYQKSKKGKATAKKALAKYFKSEKGKAAMKKVLNSEKSKQYRSEYYKSPEGKKMLYAAITKYKKTEKGRAVAKKANKKWLEKTQYYKNISKDPVKREKRNREASERHKKRWETDVEYKHLESQFKVGMTWDNYGEWHIDHIKPLAAFDIKDPAQVAEASHYTNLQPLWAMENFTKSKKRNIN